MVCEVSNFHWLLAKDVYVQVQCRQFATQTTLPLRILMYSTLLLLETVFYFRTECYVGCWSRQALVFLRGVDTTAEIFCSCRNSGDTTYLKEGLNSALSAFVFIDIQWGPVILASRLKVLFRVATPATFATFLR